MKKDIEILGITHLRGPNLWTYVPALEVLIDIGELEDFPSNLIPGLYGRLSAGFPDWSSTAAATTSAAASCADSRKAPGPGTSWSTSRWNCRRWQACRAASAGPAKPPPAASTRW